MASRPRDVELEMVIQKLVDPVSTDGIGAASTSSPGRTHHTHHTRCEAALKILRSLPRFISSVVVFMIITHIGVSGRCMAHVLMWSPGPWWRQPWRMLTYGLLHQDIIHLVGNLLFTIFCGSFLEVDQGWWRVAAVWWGGVAAGAAGAAMSHPGNMMVGASAAVFALATAHVPHVCYRYKSMRWPLVRLLLVVLCCAGAFFEWLFSLFSEGAHSDSAFPSHFAGMLAGLLLGFVVFTVKGDVGLAALAVVCRRACAALAAACCLAAGYCAVVTVTTHDIVADHMYYYCQSDLNS